MREKRSIPVSRLRELLSYNPDNGLLTWISRPSRNVHVGDIAGSTGAKYAVVCINRFNYKAHRICWALHYGEWPINEIDHINRDRKDNRICNLRDVSGSQNIVNKGLSSTNTSGFKGVTKYRHRENKWLATIKINKKQVHLGVFDDPIQAALAYDKALMKNFPDHATPNFPGERHEH